MDTKLAGFLKVHARISFVNICNSTYVILGTCAASSCIVM